MNQTTFIPIRRIQPGGVTQALEDEVVTEHHLELYHENTPFIRLICTPDHLEALITGHLYTEGFIDAPDDIRELVFSEDRILASFFLHRRPVCTAEIPTRATACGSKISLSTIGLQRRPITPVTPVPWTPQRILQNMETLLGQDSIFARTGGVHSCVLEFDGQLLDICEDIGRHNAIDKAVGLALLQGIDLTKCTLYTSGRVPTDMIEKVARSGIPIAVSHSAVTASAVEMAKQYRLTLFGFVRKTRMNLYWDPQSPADST
jgi:FdhD protein